MKTEISPSLMCANLDNLKADIKKLEKLGVAMMHIDFMDGRFVPNTTFSVKEIAEMKAMVTSSQRDIHIMAFEPGQYFDDMLIGTGDFVAVHYEACEDINAVLQDIKKRGARACVAISPDTDVSVVKNCIDNIDAVLVMTVYPGFAGQPLAKGSFEKIAAMRKLLDECGKEDIELEVDGNVSWDHCVTMRERGANIFVCGTSSVFTKAMSFEESVPKFYDLVK